MQYETNVIQSTNGTLNNSAFIKTNLMIMVIICHSAAFWTGNWFTRNPVLISVPISMLSSWLGSCHTYSFTLVSGYLFANRVYGGGYIRYLPYLWNKTKRLLIPYFFSMIVWVAPLSNYYFHWSIQTLIKKYIFCIDPSQLWFLWMLFGIFVIVWPLKEIIMMNPIIGYMISLILYFIGIVGKIFILNVFCFLTAFQYFVFFYLGMRIRIDEENKRRNVIKRIPWYSWVLADVLLFILLQMIYTKEVGGVWRLVRIFIELFLHIIGAIMGYTVFQSLANHVPWQESRIFRVFSRCSMPMYLFHQQIIYFTITALNGKIEPWMNTGINFLISFIGSLVISLLLLRWKVTRFLIGEVSAPCAVCQGSCQ